MSARAQGAPPGVLACDFQVPGPVRWEEVIPEVEIDRVYKSSRPGFLHEWVVVGPRGPQGAPWAGLVALFESAGEAGAFLAWLDQYALPGGPAFWDRPDFALGHECHVFEVLGDEDRPPTEDTQANLRQERFQVAPGTTREQLRAWYAQVQDQSRRRGDTSVMLLYSEAERLASLVYFGAVPQPQRSLAIAPPISAQVPFSPPGTGALDWSAWVLAIFSPFAPGDRGRPSLWPMPGIEPWRGDGLCEPSRHESHANDAADCLATCGDGVPDPGETSSNCPGDVPLP